MGTLADSYTFKSNLGAGCNSQMGLSFDLVSRWDWRQRETDKCLPTSVAYECEGKEEESFHVGDIKTYFFKAVPSCFGYHDKGKKNNLMSE